MSHEASPLGHEEINALIERAQAGDERARNRVIEANMRLVTKIAHPMAAASGRMADLDDLRQAGVMGPRGTAGLVRAIALFDTKRGKRFSTYATQWIRVAVRDAINEMAGATLRGGAKVRSDRVKEIATKLAVELERKPTQRELKARCVLLGVEAPSDRAIDRIEQAHQIAHDVDPDTLADARDTEADLANAQLIRQALDVLRYDLSHRQARAITLHFGLDGGDPLTLENLGDVLGTSRKGARKALNSAMVALRRAMLKGHGRTRIDSRDSSG